MWAYSSRGRSASAYATFRYDADALGIDRALCADALALHAALLERTIT